MGAPGFRKCAFPCPMEDEERCRLLLLRYNVIEPGSVRYSDGAIRFLLDLSSIPNGDGPAVEGMLLTELARHSKP